MKVNLMKTLGTKVTDEVYDLFVNKCNKKGITASEQLRELVEREDKLNEPIDFDKVFDHIKDCSSCCKAIIGKGYFLVPLTELKKRNLVPRINGASF